MAFSSSDSPDDGLGAGEGVSGRPAAAGSEEGAPRAAEGDGQAGEGELTEGKREHSAVLSDAFSIGVGKQLGVEGDSFELGQNWVSSANITKYLC